MYELALFAGAGGGILAGKLLGTRCVGAVENAEYPRRVLVARQNDGSLDPFPIWDNIKTFRSDNDDCAGYFDDLRRINAEVVISGGFPCQDISVAGQWKNTKGIEGERSGLWKEMRRVVCEIRPQFVFVENSPALVDRGLGTVLGDLAGMGYDARWGVFGGDLFDSSPILRRRMFILASALRLRWLCEKRNDEGRVVKECGEWASNLVRGNIEMFGCKYKPTPDVRGMAYGVASGMDRLTAIGNGQVACLAAFAFQQLNVDVNNPC